VLGTFAIEGRKEQEVKNTQNSFDSLIQGYFDYPEAPEEIESTFELLESNWEVYEIYQVIRPYTNKDYELNTPILLKLLDGRENFHKIIENIPHLHYSYINTILKEETSSGERNNKET
jgi:hypothetical protein